MDICEFHLNVRGRVPSGVVGRLIFTCGRRNKRHCKFGRWQDSPADLFVIDLQPGAAPLFGRIFSPGVEELELERPCGRYGAQPNHAVNISGRRAWGTNLHFGAPFGFDIESGKCLGIAEVFNTSATTPQVTSTAHFAFTPDRKFAYFQQGLLAADSQANAGIQTCALKLVRMDTQTLEKRTWELIPPNEDDDKIAHNFHSAFYFERKGIPHVGLLKTGARFNAISAHENAEPHSVLPMRGSAVWIVAIEDAKNVLKAEIVPEFNDSMARALSHLEVDTSSGEGFILYCNYKQADVAQETHGPNIYHEPPESVFEHYAGMTVEPFGIGKVVRYDFTGEVGQLNERIQPYDHGRVGDGHSWLPINLSLDSSGERLFASFAGFRPRLLSHHIAVAYPELVVATEDAGYAPPLLMRLEAKTLKPDRSTPHYLSYAEPIAFTVVPANGRDYICTISTELGLRIYDADDLSAVLCEATSHQIASWRDSHFRTDPAHVEFAAI